MRFDLESVKEEKTHIYDQLIRTQANLQVTTEECDEMRRQLLMKPQFAKPLPIADAQTMPAITAGIPESGSKKGASQLSFKQTDNKN